MAQSGYTPILIYASSTPGALPSAANLTSSASGAELAINYADGKLYFKNSSGVVTLLAGSSSGPAGGSNTQVQYNSSGVLAGSSNMTFNGTKLTVAGFLDSALTSGRVPYATTSGELTDSANLLYSGTDLTVYGITVGRGAGAVASNTAVGASALAANTTGSNQVAVGVNALNANTTGIQNIAVGTDALLSNQTGNYNTSVGVGSLRLNTASNNTALGWVALNVNTSGANNTALGFSALASNTTASNNTAVGYQAGYSNTTASYLTYIGYQAGYTNSTANVNLGIGYQALYSSTSGDNNTAVGDYRPLYSNTTGTNNIGVGREALTANTTGSYNIAVGRDALKANTTASYNTAVGYQAGYNNTTGTGNVYVGTQVGFATTGSYNTFIGTGNSAVTTPSGYAITTGSKNTIIGPFDGNRYGLDIRTASNYIVLADGDGNPLVFTANNNTVALQGGTISSGTGIAFPATQSASSNANTLDDYEEGTWTPTATSSAGTNGTLAYTSSGSYTKIGRQVTIRGEVEITNWGSRTGAFRVGGIPFTAASEFSTGSCILGNVTITGVQVNTEIGNAATTQISVAMTSSAGGFAYLQVSDFAVTANIWFEHTYFV